MKHTPDFFRILTPLDARGRKVADAGEILSLGELLDFFDGEAIDNLMQAGCLAPAPPPPEAVQ